MILSHRCRSQSRWWRQLTITSRYVTLIVRSPLSLCRFYRSDGPHDRSPILRVVLTERPISSRRVAKFSLLLKCHLLLLHQPMHS